MKRSLTLLLSVFVALGMMAQTNVTSKYITNPSFETNGTSGWVNTSMVTQGNSSFTKKEGATYLEKWVAKGSTVGNASIKQTLTNLEPGKYTLTVSAQNLDQNSETKKCTGAKIYAGSKSTTVYTPDDYSVDFVYISGNIEIGFSATSATGNWLAVDNFRLTYNGLPDISDCKTGLNQQLTAANKLYADGSGINAAAFKSVIDAAQATYDDASATAEQCIADVKALIKAIDTYKLDNVSEASPLDYTKYINNPSFEVNGTNGWTLSNLVSQSNSSFTKKQGTYYLERWVESGSAGSASVSQVIKNLPNGVYKLTVAAQNIDQKATTKKCTGAYIYAGDQSTDVYNAADYSVKFTSISGEVEIGYKGVEVGGNWISVDNFRLYLIGNIDKAGVVEEIKHKINTAVELQSKVMYESVATALQSAIDAGKLIDESSDDATITSTSKTLDSAISAANQSIAKYASLQTAIDKAETTYDESKEGAADFKSEIDKAKDLVVDPKATAASIDSEIESLVKAELAFRIANATPGSGTAPKVTATNHYVPTGSTEALMRATFTGSNIIEKGVCWSTEHEPTVLDSRTTKSFELKGTIIHIKDLKPATVYYLRPYAMNSTYTVAYGDEVKIVTHPKGTCVGTWDGGAPDEAANTRCRNAINETIEYFNQWTGIKGFTLSGHYGSATPTADCSYGGWMRIGPNAGNQAIGTVIHETGHGVGVGTQARWSDKNVHDWVWKGREANDIYHFLENQYTNSDYVMVGDGMHGWGANATYDWFVNGADKDKHYELQYIGGCVLLYGLFIDGLCPTSGYSNGIAGYTYNFDSEKKYYIRCKDADRGLISGFLYQRNATGLGWNEFKADEITDDAAWYLEYVPTTGYYRFKNAVSGKYLTHSTTGTSVTLKTTSSPSNTENFQLMPDRTDVTIGKGTDKVTTHGYWFTWNSSGNKAMQANAVGKITGYGSVSIVNFDYSDAATTQQWLIISEDELPKYINAAISTGIEVMDDATDASAEVVGIYSVDGMKLSAPQPGINIYKYANGKSKKVIIK